MQFAGLNNKRFYFYYGIASLPFGHLLLEEVRKEKKDLKKSIHQVINEKKIELLKTEASTVRQCERLRVLRSVLLQLPIHYKLDSKRLQRNYKYYHEKLYFKLKLVMIIFGLLIGILTYASTNTIYDGQFRRNILIGKTVCGKAYFVQKLTLNELFW